MGFGSSWVKNVTGPRPPSPFHSSAIILYYCLLLHFVLPNEYLEQAISDPVRVKEIKVWPCKWKVTIKQCCFFCIVAQYY